MVGTPVVGYPVQFASRAAGEPKGTHASTLTRNAMLATEVLPPVTIKFALSAPMP